MLRISSNIADVLRGQRGLEGQFRYAAAVALTRSVMAAREAMPAEVERVFDRPTAFTRTGFYALAARKEKLEATVGVKDRQAEYLLYQVEGGRRMPRNKALRLPSVVDLNEHGNMPSGLVRQLIARAKAGRRATRRQAERFGVSQSVDLFYGEPGDGRPAGIYKRVRQGTTRDRLVPVVVFPRRAATYQRRFDFDGIAARNVVRVFDDALDAAWADAMRTAR